MSSEIKAPTPEYLAAPAVGRTRTEASHGALCVVIENYATPSEVFGKSVVYLSNDGGRTFSPLDWKVSWLSWWKTLGQPWPPHDLYITGLDERALQVSYTENAYDGPIDRRARYAFAQQRWTL